MNEIRKYTVKLHNAAGTRLASLECYASTHEGGLLASRARIADCALTTQRDWHTCELWCDGELVEVCQRGVVVKLPARNSRAFRELPAVVQALLHAAHRIQFRLWTRLDVQPTEKALLQAGLLRAVKLAEWAASAANAGKVVSI